jgi:hypothetical protein
LISIDLATAASRSFPFAARLTFYGCLSSAHCLPAAAIEGLHDWQSFFQIKFAVPSPHFASLFGSLSLRFGPIIFLASSAQLS